MITRFCVAPANVHELKALPLLMEQTIGTLIGDHDYWSPAATAEWQEQGVALLAPYRRSARRDPKPHWSAALSHVRYRIDTDFGQLVDR